MVYLPPCGDGSRKKAGNLGVQHNQALSRVSLRISVAAKMRLRRWLVISATRPCFSQKATALETFWKLSPWRFEWCGMESIGEPKLCVEHPGGGGGWALGKLIDSFHWWKD